MIGGSLRDRPESGSSMEHTTGDLTACHVAGFPLVTAFRGATNPHVPMGNGLMGRRINSWGDVINMCPDFLTLNRLLYAVPFCFESTCQLQLEHDGSCNLRKEKRLHNVLKLVQLRSKGTKVDQGHGQGQTRSAKRGHAGDPNSVEYFPDGSSGPVP